MLLDMGICFRPIFGDVLKADNSIVSTVIANGVKQCVAFPIHPMNHLEHKI